MQVSHFPLPGPALRQCCLNSIPGTSMSTLRLYQDLWVLPSPESLRRQGYPVTNKPTRLHSRLWRLLWLLPMKLLSRKIRRRKSKHGREEGCPPKSPQLRSNIQELPSFSLLAVRWSFRQLIRHVRRQLHASVSLQPVTT